MPDLFEPLPLRSVTLRNRIMFSPVSQHSAGEDGQVTTWHLVHYGSRAVGGVGLILVEDTAVEPRGRLGPTSLGLYDDHQARALQTLVAFCQQQGASVGVQLGHAGRKAFAASKGQAPLPLLGPTDVPFDRDWATPRAASVDDLDRVVEAYRAAARRAAQAGFDVVEVHAAHGYLLHSFLSPLSNTRQDEFGGSADGRRRLVVRVLRAVREVWPAERPLFLRVSASDEAVGGLTPDDLLEALPAFQAEGVDVLAVSSGGLVPGQSAANPPAQQPELAARLRRHGLRTVALGGISSAAQADALIRADGADLVGLGRPLLLDPYWSLRAAMELGKPADWPRQYRPALGRT